MGTSLDFPFCNLEITLRTSSDVQSLRYILDEFVFGRKSAKLGILSTVYSPISLYASLRLVASDTKYLLNSLAITLRLVIFSLSIINCGLICLFLFPRILLISSHVFFISPDFSLNFPV